MSLTLPTSTPDLSPSAGGGGGGEGEYPFTSVLIGLRFVLLSLLYT